MFNFIPWKVKLQGKKPLNPLRRKPVSLRGGPDVWEKKKAGPAEKKSGFLDRPDCNLVTTLTELLPHHRK